MTGYLYPRLTDNTALELRAELMGCTVAEAADRYALSHPQAHFAAVGGARVGEDNLRAVRNEVLEAVEPWLRLARKGALNRATRAEMDGPLGQALHNSIEIIPADGAHDGVWSFLSLVLLPEVVVSRFPEAHITRWLGRPRNALRRTWWRQHVLGDLLEAPDDVRGLGEDELVGLFERSTLASDHRLVRALARRILGHREGDRSEFARRLSKRVLAELAFTEAAVLSDDELEELIDSAILFRAVPPPPPASGHVASRSGRGA